MPGLFIAGVFGAAISSMSVVLNSVSAVLLEDVLRGLFQISPTPVKAHVFVHCCVVVLGLAALGCLFIIDKLDGILIVSATLAAIANGTTGGIFSLGGIAGALLSGWVSLGNQIATGAGEIVARRLPVSVEGCIESLVGNVTLVVKPIYPDESGVFPLYRLSYHCITPIGFMTLMIVGTIVSFVTGPRDLRHIDPELSRMAWPITLTHQHQPVEPVGPHVLGSQLQPYRQKIVESNEKIANEAVGDEMDRANGLTRMSSPRSTMSDSIREMYQFSVIDYCMFGGMLILSAACGIYYGFFKRSTGSSANESEDEQDDLPGEGVPVKKPTNTFGSATIDEYLLGSRKLKAFPVAMSLLAGYISGVTILGTPAEIYNFGTQYWLIVVPILLMGVAVCTVYLPVFCSLKLNSSYEYLELRFNPYVRSMASIMFVINQMLFLPMVIYVPALAFNQVTGFNIYVIGAIVCVVCIFYTLLGGIKAVVFTDAWQVVVMFISVVVVVIIGTVALGGPDVIWDRAIEGGRIDFFNFNPSMYERQTFWAVLIGGFFYWTSFNAVNQTMVQRYMSLPNLKTAKFSIYMFVVGTAIFVSVCCYTGLLLYGKYYDCDPATVELVTTSDQLFPHYVMESVGHLRGMPGLFIAGVFGAALSSLSVILNTTSGVLLEDILKGLFRVTPSSLVANIVVRGSVVVLGIAAMGCLFIVDKLDGILIVSATLAAIGNGTTGGIFTLGMLVPWSNTKGALVGGIAGALLSGWISLGSQFASAAGEIMPHKLPVSVDGCIVELITNTTNANPIYPDESGVFPLYRLSYHWITPIGVTTVLVIGSIVSFLTGPRDLRHIDPELISPVIHRFLPRESFSYFGTANKAPKSFGQEMQTQTNIPSVGRIPYGSADGQNDRVKA
uniref:Sodium-coupled monocarboxylate transporter 1 n=1 Tax=Anopheles christyi TaxID=43041 RepID=A0A182K6Z5_9DIPT